MATPPRHAPPPIAWRSTPAGVAQPACTFAAHQRPQVPGRLPPGRAAPAGDELVSAAAGHFQLRSPERNVLTSPSGVYNFVRVQGATRNQTSTVLSSRAPHAALAAGRPVLYAGTAAFESGELRWWSNYSGTYQPQAEFNRQAALPGDKFVPWQKLQLGGVGLQRGMLSDNRRATAPQQTPSTPRPATQAAAEQKQDDTASTASQHRTSSPDTRSQPQFRGDRSQGR